LFYMNYDTMAREKSYEHGGQYKEYETQQSFRDNETRFQSLYQMWKKVDYDIDYDDSRLHNHHDKAQLRVLNKQDPDWQYKVPKDWSEF
jgi:hypothetical protein